MTDEERQRLCEDLRAWRTKTVLQVDATCKQAADEIMRLAAELKRANSPVWGSRDESD